MPGIYLLRRYGFSPPGPSMLGMGRVVHVGKIYRVSRNESGYLVWIPRRLAEEAGLKHGDEVVLVASGRRIVITPADDLAREVGRHELRDIGEAAV